jgi:hypothetical protein
LFRHVRLSRTDRPETQSDRILINLCNPLGRTIGGCDLSFVIHELCNVSRFAAGRGACVKDLLAWMWVKQIGNQLRRFALNLEESLLITD